MTIRQVADYYEVDINTIWMLYKRNKAEVDADGVQKHTSRTIQDTLKRIPQDLGLVKTQSGIDIKISKDIYVSIPNCGVTCFSQRAVLRIGMLLRDSKIAKEVRTQLLNTFEEATVDQRLAAMSTEQKLIYDISEAMLHFDAEKFQNSLRDFTAFYNRHIDELKDKVKELTNENKKLAECNANLSSETIDWAERKELNRMVQSLSAMSDTSAGYIWNNLYSELTTKYGIALRLRGEKPYIAHLYKTEWNRIVECFTIVCEKYGFDGEKMLSDLKITANL